jgi:predicted membrane protein
MNKTQKLVVSALFIALGIVLPFFTGQIQQIGSMLCPMHIPIILCGFICGAGWGTAVGFITPLLRSMMFGMPPFMTALSMAFELATYGLVAGLLYPRFKRGLAGTYITLLITMILGRVVLAVANGLIAGLNATEYGFQIWLSSSILGSIPGIILQLILIPVIISALQKTNHIR